MEATGQPHILAYLAPKKESSAFRFLKQIWCDKIPYVLQIRKNISLKSDFYHIHLLQI
jgi:hypothetical protein